MNILSDTLKDFKHDIIQRALPFMDSTIKENLENEGWEELMEEYIERIKNELNVEKYLT